MRPVSRQHTGCLGQCLLPQLDALLHQAQGRPAMLPIVDPEHPIP
jgi:hypothetical protein